MSRIADAKQPVAAPITKTIDLYRQQFDFGPVIELCHSIAQKFGEADDVVLKLPQPARFDFIESALWNYKAALPIITTVEQHEQLAVLKEAERLLRIVLLL